jgi:hypothetical protein
MAPVEEPDNAESLAYLAENGRTLLCRGCDQKMVSVDDDYHDESCRKRAADRASDRS